MKTLFRQHIESSDIRFIDFIRRSRRNRLYFWAGIVVSIVGFFIFKLFYPNPNMVMDSYIYIRAMVLNMGANSFPIGYSKCLQLFSLFSRSMTALVWIQYLFLETACLLFFFTLLYFFRPGRVATALLFLFLFVNPIFLYTSNFIMSDTLFNGLSILWLTQLIWILGRPKLFMITIHALLLAVAFSVRYNALYYPFVATLVLILCQLTLWKKVVAIGLQFALVGGFVIYTQGQMKELTGVRQFSPFGGWQLANNALFMYKYACQNSKDPVPAKFVKVDSVVRHYFKTTREDIDLMNYQVYSSGNNYMSDNTSPLQYYMRWQYGRDTVFQDFKKWGPMGQFTGEYGSYLIHNYPVDYVRYFVTPNFYRYWLPPPEIFATLSPYFLRDDGLGQLAINWFGVKTLGAQPAYVNFRTALFAQYPISIALAHVLFILGFLGFAFIKGFKKVSRTNAYILVVIGSLWLCDLCFSITASAIVLRYRVFLMVVEVAIALLLVDFIYADSEKQPGKT